MDDQQPVDPMNTSYALQLSGINKQYPGVKALTDVHLNVGEGEVHALVGENGAGKSTFLKVISGVISPDGGEILLDGKKVTLNFPKDAKRAGIAMIHQELQLIPELDVVQNLFLGAPLVHRGGMLDRAAMVERARTVLAPLDPAIPLTAKIRQLSVAQKQMVEIARALLASARVIAMDEPTSSLTPAEFKKLAGIIRQLSQQGVAVIYVSHKLDEIYEVCSRATVLRDGKFIDELALADMTQQQLVHKMVGRELVSWPKREYSRTDIVLSAQSLSWGERVRDVSLTLHKGEILGIAGLVGAGRTELVRLLAGVERADTGDIHKNGKRLRLRSPRDAIRAGIALVPEERKLDGIIPMQSIFSNICLPVLDKWTRAGVVRRGELHRRASALAQQVNLRPPKLSRPIRLLSGGNQQKAIICRWLNSGADVLIFDEPTRGVDVGAKQEIYQLIEQIVNDGRSVIIVSSELDEVMRLSDRLLVMQSGRISGELKSEEFSEAAIMTLAIPRDVASQPS